MSYGFGQLAYGAGPYGAGSIQTELRLLSAEGEIRRVDPIEFVVTNEAWPVASVVVSVFLSDGRLEVAWTTDGGFTENYVRASACYAILHGYRFVLRRTRGWLSASIRIDVAATDLAGEVVRGQASWGGPNLADYSG